MLYSGKITERISAKHYLPTYSAKTLGRCALLALIKAANGTKAKTHRLFFAKGLVCLTRPRRVLSSPRPSLQTAQPAHPRRRRDIILGSACRLFGVARVNNVPCHSLSRECYRPQLESTRLNRHTRAACRGKNGREQALFMFSPIRLRI